MPVFCHNGWMGTLDHWLCVLAPVCTGQDLSDVDQGRTQVVHELN